MQIRFTNVPISKLVVVDCKCQNVDTNTPGNYCSLCGKCKIPKLKEQLANACEFDPFPFTKEHILKDEFTRDSCTTVTTKSDYSLVDDIDHYCSYDIYYERIKALVDLFGNNENEYGQLIHYNEEEYSFEVNVKPSHTSRSKTFHVKCDTGLELKGIRKMAYSELRYVSQYKLSTLEEVEEYWFWNHPKQNWMQLTNTELEQFPVLGKCIRHGTVSRNEMLATLEYELTLRALND